MGRVVYSSLARLLLFLSWCFEKLFFYALWNCTEETWAFKWASWEWSFRFFIASRSLNFHSFLRAPFFSRVPFCSSNIQKHRTEQFSVRLIREDVSRILFHLLLLKLSLNFCHATLFQYNEYLLTTSQTWHTQKFAGRDKNENKKNLFGIVWQILKLKIIHFMCFTCALVPSMICCYVKKRINCILFDFLPATPPFPSLPFCSQKPFQQQQKRNFLLYHEKHKLLYNKSEQIFINLTVNFQIYSTKTWHQLLTRQSFPSFFFAMFMMSSHQFVWTFFSLFKCEKIIKVSLFFEKLRNFYVFVKAFLNDEMSRVWLLKKFPSFCLKYIYSQGLTRFGFVVKC